MSKHGSVLPALPSPSQPSPHLPACRSMVLMTSMLTHQPIMPHQASVSTQRQLHVWQALRSTTGEELVLFSLMSKAPAARVQATYRIDVDIFQRSRCDCLGGSREAHVTVAWLETMPQDHEMSAAGLISRLYVLWHPTNNQVRCKDLRNRQKGWHTYRWRTP